MTAIRVHFKSFSCSLSSTEVQIAQLEVVANEVVNLESRLEAAESERDVAVEKARVFTPRPAASLESTATPLNEEATKLIMDAIATFRCVRMKQVECSGETASALLPKPPCYMSRLSRPFAAYPSDVWREDQRVA